MSEPDRFSWSDGKSIVVKRVNAIAVYKNDEGNLIIRQESDAERADLIVVVPIQHAWTFIEAVTREVKGNFPGYSPTFNAQPENALP
jgi:hypothetical protein